MNYYLDAKLVEWIFMSEVMESLINFINESNRIEGIHHSPTEQEVTAYEDFLSLSVITIEDIEKFVRIITNAPVRSQKGMDVYVGKHTPIPGGPRVIDELNYIIQGINSNKYEPYYIHQEYEKLHPFMDGNGRSGRIIWAWMMHREGRNPFHLGFLHTFYYQTLENSRI